MDEIEGSFLFLDRDKQPWKMGCNPITGTRYSQQVI